ncbi:dihydrolipoamide acetyltransferase family protein [Nocardiopsis composta]|uniref:Dihydrolipoamide acetyltransferase component of pyruvate dehydrogenase complex n=1 Tax=Nocardiopsis composta TaxID=157465 RepID=A0A7W8QLL7_9ACTN|nr:dihydrolipoamide acetyltransferase family protein [Nocardiopsis composta]MBB5432018.1 pyruvate dehydrogenase E2 component (dihydrolipoamide acetyltransferase) [Nocardiopsis composta]
MSGAPRVFELPDLGEGLTDAEVVSWLVQVGDRVAVDQPVAEVETAKAAVEVPCPFAGTVAALHAEAGAVVAVGAPLISITEEEPASGASSPGHSPGPALPEVVVPEARTPDSGPGGNGAARAPEGSGAVLVGYGTGAAAPRRPGGRRRRPAPGAAPSRGAPGGGAGTTESPAPAPSSGGPVPVVSPLVRRLARENGVDLRALAGSGGNGLVLRRDVEAAIAAARSPSGSAAAGPAPAVSAAAPGEERVPLRGARAAMAERLSRSRREIPEATVWVDADATGLVELRRRLNAAAPDRPVSLLGLLARFCVLGLSRFPELNSAVDTEHAELVRFSHVNLGFAAQTPRGLVVPVVRDAHRMSARELSAAITETSEAARSGPLPPERLSGGTFTVNNYGVFGVDGSAAIINHPEAAILGMGRIVQRPWVVGGELAARPVTELTLAFDHRVCDGATAGGFLRFVADCVEDPALLLGDL